MNNKKGFTLVELLAVIVVLAVLALIVMPTVTDVIKTAKNSANLRSAESYVKAAENYYSASIRNEIDESKLGTNVINDLQLSNAKAEGSVIVNSDGTIEIALIIDNKCYKKGVNQGIRDIEVFDDISNCIPKTLSKTVLAAFPQLELGTNGCKTPSGINYSYMGGCYLRGGQNLKEKYNKMVLSTTGVTLEMVNQTFDVNGNFINAKFEELILPKMAEEFGMTVVEMKEMAASEGMPLFNLLFEFSEQDLNDFKQVYNNYLWYSGFIWRIMGINADGTIRLITAENVTSIPYNVANNVNFNGSHVDKWLNEYFLANFKGSDIVALNNFCQGAAIVNSSPRNDCTGGLILNRKVGLISIDEYNFAGDAYSYLNEEQSFYTMSPYDTSSIWETTNGGEIYSVTVDSPEGIRVVLNVDSSTIVDSGNGILNGSPYILKGNKSINTPTLLKEQATSGEYVKFANKTYRVVSIDVNGNTKLILDGYYQEPVGTNYAIAYGTDNTFTLSSGVGQKLNGDVFNYLVSSSDTVNRNKLVTNYTWYQNNFGLGNSYTVSLNESTPTRSIQSNVGLIRIGEMLSGQSYSILTKNGTVISKYNNSFSYWLMTSGDVLSKTWFANDAGNAYIDRTTRSFAGIRPVIVVKSTINITGGTGTPLSPYEI